MAHAHLDFGDEADRLVASARGHAERYEWLAAQLVKADDQVLVDVGCGGAGMTVAMSRQQPTARVIGIDAEAPVLDAARRFVASEGVNVALVQADLDNGFGELETAVGAPADVIWCSHVIHHLADQQAALNDLARLLSPTGRLVIAEGGLTPRHLPWDLGFGRPGIERRLEAAGNVWFAALRDGIPGSVPMSYGWNVALERAGLSMISTIQDLSEWPPPLTDAQRTHVLDDLAARVGWVDEYLDDDDRDVWAKLLDPDSGHWLGRRDDLYRLNVDTIYVAHNNSR